MINHVSLTNFKNITLFETDLDKINILIGANNSGKSSVLQGIHFSIMAEVIRRNIQKTNIPEDQLLYLPSSDFLRLRHDKPYTVSSGLTSTLSLKNEYDEDFVITISKGRNSRNISVIAENNNPFRQQVTAFNPLYSMYVPGISGIPIREKYVTKAELRSAVARGDANMYIRNIVYQLALEDKLEELNTYLQTVFPYMAIEVPYNPDVDLYVGVNLVLKHNGEETTVPLEQCGTGTLQVLQIIAYVLFFSPQLLLLDEPDEHLHPDNQGVLASVLETIVDKDDVQIVLCTHSRSLLNVLSDVSRIIWMKDGSIVEAGETVDRYNVLMDIGALDYFDNCIGGKYKYVIMTEDRDLSKIDLLLKANGFEDYFLFSYKSCTHLDTVSLFISFIHQANPDCKIIVHRDKDFMVETEIQYVKERLEAKNVYVFITKGSDIESYFVEPNHVSCLLDVPIEEVEKWQDEIIRDNTIEITLDFDHLRDACKHLPIYKKNPNNCPSSKELIKDALTTDNVKGKYMLKKMNGTMFSKFGKEVNLIQESSFLVDSSLKCAFIDDQLR